MMSKFSYIVTSALGAIAVRRGRPQADFESSTLSNNVS